MSIPNKTKLELINHIYKTLSDKSGFREIIKSLSDIIKEYFECSYTDVVLVDNKNQSQYTVYGIAQNGTFVENAIDPHGVVKKTIENKETIAADDVSKISYYYPARKDTKAELCVPILYKRKIVGCLNIEFKSVQKFDKDTTTTLEIIGQTIGSIVRNARLHEDLEQSEKTFRQLVEHMNEGLWVGDKKHNTVYVNPKFAEMAGLSHEECLKRDCFGFYDKESVKRIHEQHKIREKGVSSQYELTMIKSNGETIPILCSGAPIPDGTVGIFTNLKFIKEKEKQIKDLSKSEKLLVHVSDNSIDAIVSMDKNLVINSWNKGAVKMFGYEKEEIIGKSIKTIMPPTKIKEEELEQIIKITLEKGFLKNFETVRVTKSGKEINVAISITKLLDESNHFIGFAVIYRDITYQKKAEKELQTRFESMQNAYMELGKQRRELDYLLETLDIAIGDEQFPDIENYIVNAAIMLTKANAATLRLYSEKDGFLHLKAASGVRPEWWGKARSPFAGTLAEKAYHMHKPLFIDEIQNNPLYTSQKLATEHGFVSSLIIPLYVKTKYIGNLALYSNNKNKLHLIDNSFIANFGKQASLALFTKSV